MMKVQDECPHSSVTSAFYFAVRGIYLPPPSAFYHMAKIIFCSRLYGQQRIHRFESVVNHCITAVLARYNTVRQSER